MNKVEITQEKLTGNVRFRSERGLIGGEKLVLQLETTIRVNNGAIQNPNYVQATGWRDAQSSDLTKSSLKAVKPESK